MKTPKTYLFLGFGPISNRIINRISTHENAIIHVISNQAKNPLLLNTNFWSATKANDLIESTNFDVVICSWRSIESTIHINRQEFLTKLAKINLDTLFVNLSSVAVYGESEGLREETSMVIPINSYGVDKLEIERVLCHAEFSRVQNLRLSNVFGDKGFKDVINRILDAALSNVKLSLTQPDLILRDFVHIDTVVDYIDLITNDFDFVGFETTNVASGISTSLLQVFEIFNQFFDGQLTYAINNVRPDEIRVSRLSVEKFMSKSEFKPISFGKQLQNYISECTQ